LIWPITNLNRAMSRSSSAALRGYSAPKLIIKDEAAFVSDAMQAALDPMLAVSKGRLIARTSFWRCWSASTVLA